MTPERSLGFHTSICNHECSVSLLTIPNLHGLSLSLQCSVSCGAGVSHRKVKCVAGKNRLLDSHLCENETRPEDIKSCFVAECARFQWHVSKWSQVSLGNGTSFLHAIPIWKISLECGHMSLNMK